MRYVKCKAFKAIKRNGQAKKPAYIGLMVLMDYLNPKVADAYREIKCRIDEMYAEAEKRFPYPKWGDLRSESIREQREAWREPIYQQIKADFAALCAQCARKRKK
jgi:hypothetical protein